MTKKNHLRAVRFEYIRNIDELPMEELAVKGFYRGYVCPHGHTIRHVEDHWCYHCAEKIFSNICGIDVNYLHSAYKFRVQSLFQLIDVGDPKECWEPKNGADFGKKRFCIHSYRSLFRRERMENMTPAKAIYHGTWGDVGALSVTRTCGNLNCFNPLHLRSDFNVQITPKTIHPFDINFNHEKLMVAGKAESGAVVLEDIMRSVYKNTIKSPVLMKEDPE